MDETDAIRRPATGRLLVSAALLAAVAAACGNDSTSDASSTAENTTPVGPTTTAASVAAEPECGNGSLDDRGYILCTAGDQSDQGLVVAIHGRGSSASDMQAMTELERYAAEEGLAVVYPDGIDDGWGDDTFPTPTHPTGDEDVIFLDDLVEELGADPRIDAASTGVVGFSNGASMALRYAAQRPDTVQAVVSVAGQLPRDPSVHPVEPVSLLQIYGVEDPVRDHETGIAEDPDREPGTPTPTLPTSDTVAAFVDVVSGDAEHDGPTETGSDPADGTSVLTERWTGDDGTVVVLHSIAGGGHKWPSEHTSHPRGDDFGVASSAIDASAAAIAFILDPTDIG